MAPIVTNPLPVTGTDTGQILRDRLNRSIHDLRISVIDRCNFRCPYCMPEEEYSHNYTFLKKKDWLTFDEITRLVRIFTRLGVSKVRITGGEPLLRPELEKLIRSLRQLAGVDDLALTTNGTFLAEQAAALYQAGLQRLTVSLDTLDAGIFRTMNGNKGSVKHVLSGIEEAERAGFCSIKINVVVQKGINEHTVLDLIEHFRGTGHIVRFIEYMDVGTCNHWESAQVVPSAQILKTIHERFPLKALEPNYHGEVASRYEYVDGKGEIGFISSVTQPFCRTCTRARLSTDGKLYPCLFTGDGIDLREPLRDQADDSKLEELITQTWQKREDRYSEQRAALIAAHKSRKKVEMYQIGG